MTIFDEIRKGLTWDRETVTAIFAIAVAGGALAGVLSVVLR